MFENEIPPLGNGLLRRHHRGPRVRFQGPSTTTPNPSATGGHQVSPGGQPTPTAVPAPTPTGSKNTNSEPQYNPDGSAKSDDLGKYNHNPKSSPKDQNWQGITTTGNLDVDHKKLEEISSALDADLATLKDAIDRLNREGGAPGANFGNSNSATYYTNLTQSTQSAFTAYLADVLKSYGELSSGLLTAKGHYGQAETDSTLPTPPASMY